MTVDQLRDILNAMPGDAEVLIEGGPDHTYITISRARLEVVAEGSRQAFRRHGGSRFAEYCGREHASPDEEPVNAVVIRP
jgi:hypothetical protein